MKYSKIKKCSFSNTTGSILFSPTSKVYKKIDAYSIVISPILISKPTGRGAGRYKMDLLFFGFLIAWLTPLLTPASLPNLMALFDLHLAPRGIFFFFSFCFFSLFGGAFKVSSSVKDNDRYFGTLELDP